MTGPVLVVGDLHGNARYLYEKVIPYAVVVGASRILQVGDFGFVWPSSNYLYGLDKMSRVLDRLGLDLHFLPGNHEDHPKLERLSKRAKALSPEGHFQLRPRLFYTGRFSAWSWEGRRFAAVGGAVSIDRDSRRRYKVQTGRDIWWPEEALTPEEIQAASQLGAVDVLFTHDAPVQNPFKLKEDLEAHIHSQAITTVAYALQPKLWFHGHHHESATYPFRHPGGWCKVIGLGRDHAPLGESTSVLRLSSNASELSSV
jgi:hypothetical protein